MNTIISQSHWQQTSLPHNKTQPDIPLYERIIDPANLMAAWKRVRSNKGSQGGDGVTWQRFEARLDQNLAKLSEDLVSGRYRPGRLRKVWIPKKDGGRRKLSIPPIRDRIVQTAASLALTPQLDPLMSDHSYAYRPGRSVDMALHKVKVLMSSDHDWIVDLDIKQFFDRIPHQRLMMELAIWGNDEQFLKLSALWLRSFVPWRRKLFFKGRGIAQGAPISPLFANLYLHPVDRILAAANIRAVRYADDIVLLCKNEREAQQTRQFMESMILGRGLEINQQKSAILHASQGFTFLGEKLGGKDFLTDPALDFTKIQTNSANGNNQNHADNSQHHPAKISATAPQLALENHG